MVTTRLLIGSDVRLYSEGLRQFLGTQAGFEVVGTAVHAAAVLAEVRRWDPDVVLLDQALPGSLETLRGIRRISPSCRVVVLGVPDQEEAMLHWAEVGAVGFVPRDASLEDLVETSKAPIAFPYHSAFALAQMQIHQGFRLLTDQKVANPNPDLSCNIHTKSSAKYVADDYPVNKLRLNDG